MVVDESFIGNNAGYKFTHSLTHPPTHSHFLCLAAVDDEDMGDNAAVSNSVTTSMNTMNSNVNKLMSRLSKSFQLLGVRFQNDLKNEVVQLRQNSTHSFTHSLTHSLPD